jgi:transposase
MKRFIEQNDRTQGYLPPESIEEYVTSDNPVRVIDAFVEELDLGQLGFAVLPEATGRPGYHPSSLLKIYIYGYLNRIQSSRRLERETQRNLELMWLTGRLMPDFKTIANFVRPAKAGAFCGRQSHRGNSRSPVAWVAGLQLGNRDSEAYRQGHRKGGCESPGRSASERMVASRLYKSGGRALEVLAKAA